MATHRRSLLAVVSIIIIGFTMALPRTAAAAHEHLWWAGRLVSNLPASQNGYSSSTQITWAGVNGAQGYSSYATCSNFVTRVLQQAYGWSSVDLANWLGSPTPLASRYHDAIVDGEGFELVPTVDEIESGDLIAIRYPEGSAVSGHMAIIDGPPVLRVATSPLVADTWQFEVRVIDSSSSNHGPLDSRVQPDGTIEPGAGMGVMRLYTNDDLEIVGYTWSTYNASTYRDGSEYHMVIGRLL